VRARNHFKKHGVRPNASRCHALSCLQWRSPVARSLPRRPSTSQMTALRITTRMCGHFLRSTILTKMGYVACRHGPQPMHCKFVDRSCISTLSAKQHRMMTSRGCPPAHDNPRSPRTRQRSLRRFTWITCLASSLAWACTNHVHFHSLECMSMFAQSSSISSRRRRCAHRSRVSLLL
jgi:hypothetical protein